MAEDIPPSEEEYELLPHKEIEELKDELAKLKEFEIAPSKKMQVSLLELNTKLDKLITIFEDASHEMRVEEGGMSFTEKMRPLLEKMGKILEQNSEIASGIVALADMMKEVKLQGSEVRHVEPEMPMPAWQETGQAGWPQGAPAQTPPLNSPPLAGLPPRPAPSVPPVPPMNAGAVPPLPPLPRRRTFGI